MNKRTTARKSYQYTISLAWVIPIKTMEKYNRIGLFLFSWLHTTTHDTTLRKVYLNEPGETTYLSLGLKEKYRVHTRRLFKLWIMDGHLRRSRFTNYCNGYIHTCCINLGMYVISMTITLFIHDYKYFYVYIVNIEPPPTSLYVHFFIFWSSY